MSNQKRMTIEEFLTKVNKHLIVSCQALPEEPLHGSEIMVRMARAAKQGGACAIRANSPEDVKAIKDDIGLPVIGIFKETLPGFNVYITPTMKHVLAIAETGAEVVAIDATSQEHPDGDLRNFIQAIKDETPCLVMADISTYAEGMQAAEYGADLVSTTLAGYTPYSEKTDGPNLTLVAQLAKDCNAPVIAEGRYHTPEQVIAAFENGAASVVVGGAITRPQQITARFVQALNDRYGK
jgi:N-acylglucosamine-6-phosphate 2-epimerase